MERASIKTRAQKNLELHVRCVPDEDQVQLYVDFGDGSTVSLNRSSGDDMTSTLRRLSLTVQKRRRIADSKAGGGKPKGGKKRAKADNSGGGGGDDVTAGLFDKGTGEPVEVEGELNRDGWLRLCGGHENLARGAPRSSEGDGSAPGACSNNGDDSRSNGSNGTNGPAVVRIGPTAVSDAAPATPDAAAENGGPATGAPSPAAPVSAATASAAAAAASASRMDGAVLELDVVVNPPAVTSLECAVALPMAGFSIVARAEAEFCTGTEWEWLREEGPARGGDGDDEMDSPQERTSAAGAAVGAGGGGGVGRGGGARKSASNGGKKKKNKGVDGGQPAAGAGGGFPIVVGSSRAYTPVDADIGRRLMVRCTPLRDGGKRRGRSVVRVLTEPVRRGRQPGPVVLRRQWLEERGGCYEEEGSRGRGDIEMDDFSGSLTAGKGGSEAGAVAPAADRGRARRSHRLRVMCYNILADMYCTSEQADEVLYPYCAKEFRAMDYRMQMVAREIRGHAADLIMLQECEVKAFDRFLAPGLTFDGFEGIYLNKAGRAQEGEAIFYRSSALTLESRHDFTMKDAIPALQEFRDLLKAFPSLKTIVEERLTTVAQVAVFRPSSKCGDGDGGGVIEMDVGEQEKEAGKEEGSPVRLIVANTHLYFHPNAAHIRLMQLVALVDRISILKKDLIARGLRPAVVLGGDLNSPPFGPVRYLMGEVIGPDSDLWSNVETFKWGDRFFDEIGAVADTAAAAAAARTANEQDGPTAAVPTPIPGGNANATTTATSQINNKNVQGGPVSGAASTASGGGAGGGGGTKRRPCLPGVPYLRSTLDLALASGTPAFTNFTPEFTETLDYVFVDGGRREEKAAAGNDGSTSGRHADMGVSSDDARARARGAVLTIEGSGGEGSSSASGAIAPMPEEGPLRATTPGLPSEAFPSDHVSLVVDLLFSP